MKNKSIVQDGSACVLEDVGVDIVLGGGCVAVKSASICGKLLFCVTARYELKLTMRLAE